MLERPTPALVREGLRLYREETKYSVGEEAVRLVFERWARHRVEAEVLVKVAALNQLFSTNIYDTYAVARHIAKCPSIDARLGAGDPTLVDDIARIAIGGRRRRFYSFATKYCAFHNADAFQVYDMFVDGVLWAYRRKFAFMRFARPELRDYPRFIAIVDGFRAHFGLEAFSRRDLDKFLWITGKGRGDGIE